MRTTASILIMILLLAGSSCKNSKSGRSEKLAGTPVEKEWYLDAAGFQKTIDGKQNDLYRLSNEAGMEVYVTNYGAVIPAILVPDKDGNIENVTLGFDAVDNYTKGDPSFGCVPGRYANRIDGGKFELDGKVYELPINETARNNQLHGGTKGFHEQVWETAKVSDNSISLKLVSPDGDMGYPGKLELTVTYTLKDDNALEIDYYAVTDAPTVLNVTHHAYFNLLGEGKGDILNHDLMINADHYTPVNERLIPTGEIATVKGTPMDFTSPIKIGAHIDDDFHQLNYGSGYDHNWVLNEGGEGLNLAAEAYCEETGRVLEVLTTEPGVQLYTGNHLNGSWSGKSGAAYEKRGGFCLETQHFPDSPNHPEFPSTLLKPGEEFKSSTVFKFSVKQ